MNKEKNVWKSGQARGRTGVRPLVVAIIATVASVFSIQPAGATGETARVVVAGRQVLLPFGVCRSRDGELLLTQPRCRTVFGVNPTTGAIRIVSTGGILGIPNGIAAEQSGAILVANGVELIRVDALTGAQHVVSAGGLFKAPIGVAIAADNFIYVADAAGLVVRVDPSSGAQTLISSGGYFNRPQGIAIRGSDIYVTDVADRLGNVGVGRVLHVDLQTGSQRVVAEGGYLVGPISIEVEPNGELLVGNPYPRNFAGQEFCEGSIVRINPETQAQSFVGPGTLILDSYAGIAEAGIIQQQFWVGFLVISDQGVRLVRPTGRVVLEPAPQREPNPPPAPRHGLAPAQPHPLPSQLPPQPLPPLQPAPLQPAVHPRFIRPNNLVPPRLVQPLQPEGQLRPVGPIPQLPIQPPIQPPPAHVGRAR